MARNLFDEDTDERPSKGDAKMVELKLYLHADRPLSIRVSDDGNVSNSEFLAKSQIRYEPGLKPGLVTVWVPEWMAKDKGFV